MTRAGTPSRALMRMAITGIYWVRGIPLDVQHALREYAGGAWTPKPNDIHG